MRAAVFEGPGKIMVRQVPDPSCEPDGIVVRVMACGICGSDVRNYRAGLRNGKEGQIMGHEISGVVEQVGSDCVAFTVGDRVAVAPDVSCGSCYYCRQGLVNLCTSHRMVGTHWPGGFAELLALPRVVLEHGMVHAIPDGVSFSDAALAEPLASVLAAQETAGVGPGRSVAVFGSGSAGCMHVQIARWRGAAPVVLVGRRRLSLAMLFRPDVAVQVNDGDPAAAVRKATEGLGADIAIIATPSAESQEQGIQSVRKRGTVVLFGGLPRESPFPRMDTNRIHYDELRVMGSFSYPAGMHVEALRAIQGGRITPDLLVSAVVGLADITEAILSAERGEVLKVVVDPGK
jgi:L-iditol 2-dehydrogenase